RTVTFQRIQLIPSAIQLCRELFRLDCRLISLLTQTLCGRSGRNEIVLGLQIKTYAGSFPLSFNLARLLLQTQRCLLFHRLLLSHLRSRRSRGDWSGYLWRLCLCSHSRGRSRHIWRLSFSAGTSRGSFHLWWLCLCPISNILRRGGFA